jgi:hypothetical protein
MARISKQLRLRITTELACFTTPSEVRDLVKREFGMELSLSTITHYDGSLPSVDLSKGLREVFTKTRARFLEDCSAIPIANLAYRLRELQKLLEKEKDRENTVGARASLEQAAKEIGGAFTNKQEFTGAGGGPIGLTVQFVSATPAPGGGK